MGIGLATVDRIIKRRHGGEVSAEGEPGCEVIERVARQVAGSEVEDVAGPIFAGMRQAREMFQKEE